MTTVLGTAFNINAYTDRSNIQVSVSRGKVKVSRGNQLIATLIKDQEVKVSQSGETGPQKVLSTNSVAAWQQGNMVYDDETLGDITADLQRVYNVNIQVVNDKMLALQDIHQFPKRTRHQSRTGNPMQTDRYAIRTNKTEPISFSNRKKKLMKKNINSRGLKYVSNFSLGLMFSSFILFGKGPTQDLSKTVIAFEISHGNLKQAFKKIETETHFFFTFKTEDVLRYTDLNFSSPGISVDKLLNTLLSGTESGLSTTG